MIRSQADKMMWLSKVAENTNITDGQFKIAFVIIDHLNCKTGRCNPSVSRIARLAGVKERMARYSIKALEENDLISVERNGTGNNKLTNDYRFNESSVNTGDTPAQNCTPAPDCTPAISRHFTPAPDCTLTNEIEPIKKYTKKELENEFENFWIVCGKNWFGNRGNKQEARKEFLKFYPEADESFVRKITQSVINQSERKKYNQSKNAFVANMKNVVRWLGKESWNDDLDKLEKDTTEKCVSGSDCREIPEL